MHCGHSCGPQVCVARDAAHAIGGASSDVSVVGCMIDIAKLACLLVQVLVQVQAQVAPSVPTGTAFFVLPSTDQPWNSPAHV